MNRVAAFAIFAIGMLTGLGVASFVVRSDAPANASAESLPARCGLTDDAILREPVSTMHHTQEGWN